MRLNSTYIWLICAPLFVSAMDSYAFTTVAMTKGNPRATMFIASGYGTQQEADDAAVSGCKAILQARGWNSIDSANTRCDELKRQPRPGFGAIACNGASSCSTGYGSTEQAAREAALNSCAALFTQTNGGSAYKCSLGTKLGQREIEIAGLWLDDNKPSVQRQAGQGTASAPPAATTGQNSAPSPAQPSGSLKLLCQMQTGQSYIFVIDERTQQVSVRNSTGQDWAIFRNGQLTRQQMGDKAIAMVDSVRVDPAAIRALREPRDDPSGSAPPNVSSDRQTNEFAGLLVTLAGVVVTTSSVVIDRNSGVIRTGGMGMFPKNGVGNCEPWSGRRF